MIELNLKLWSWIIVTIVFIAYNVFFNKEEKGGMYGGYTFDSTPLVRFGISLAAYLIFWIAWLIVT